VWLVLGALAGLIFAAFFFVFSLINFIEGRYLTGRSTNGTELREAWDAYGPGAYAGDSPMHLLFAGGALALIVLTVGTFVGRTRGWPVDHPIVGWIAAGIVTVAAAATLVLLIGNWSRGIPLSNFRPLGADGLLYAMWCVVPLIVLAGVGYGVVDRIRKHAARDRPRASMFSPAQE
jgi:hypothetical protein